MIKLIKTREYISTMTTRERVGHHVYVVEREMMNLHTPLDEMTAPAVAKFDRWAVSYLKSLDVEH